MGIDAWASIFAVLVILLRYVAYGMIIVGIFLSRPGSNIGWTRMIRYVSFIYGVTYFYYNLFNNTKDSTIGIKTISSFDDRSNFGVMYKTYVERSNYLLKFERSLFDFFPTVEGSKGLISVEIAGLFNELFYEILVYIGFIVASLVTVTGLRIKGCNALAMKLNSLRWAFSLSFAPGLLGKALQFQFPYSYWKNDFGLDMKGKGVAGTQTFIWVVLAIVIFIDWLILLTSCWYNKQ